MPTRLLQVSDTHLFADPSKVLLGVNTFESCQAICQLILQKEQNANTILLTGDLAQDQSKEAYYHLAHMFKLIGKPAYYIPGNHDNFPLMETVFPGSTISKGKHLIIGNWQIIFLNSQKVHAVEGLLVSAQLKFLKNCLTTHPEYYALVVLHHHAIPVGAKWLDQFMLTNADDLWQLLIQYPNVKGVLSGHVHQEFSASYHHINFYSAPSTCFQFKCGQDEFGIEKLPPGYRWLDLFEDGRLITGVNRLPNFIGKFEESAHGY